MKRYLVSLSALALGGCASMQGLRTDLSALPPETGQETAALIGTMRDVYDRCRQESTGDGKSRQTRTICTGFRAAVQGGGDPSDAVDPAVLRFVDAGMTLSDFYCDRFFRSTNQSARHRRHARGLTNSVGGAVATAMGLARVASGVVGGVAGGFAFADAEFRNYDDSFLVSADLSKMRRLVLSAQDNMKYAIYQAPPRSVFAAESAILRYAGLCSFLGMQDLLNDSVAGQTKAFDELNKLAKKDADAPDAGIVAPVVTQSGNPAARPPVRAPDAAPAPADPIPTSVPPPPPPA